MKRMSLIVERIGRKGICWGGGGEEESDRERDRGARKRRGEPVSRRKSRRGKFMEDCYIDSEFSLPPSFISIIQYLLLFLLLLFYYFCFC